MSDRDDRIEKLEEELARKKNEIEYYEKLVAAHDRVEALAHQELVEAERTIEAQEVVQDLLLQERQDADRMIRAQQSVVELSVMEKQTAEETIRAHEQLHSLSRNEIAYAEETIRAHQEISRLSVEEISQRDMVLREILETGRQLGAILDVRKLMRRIAESLVDILGTPRVAILVNHEHNRLRPTEIVGMDADEIGAPQNGRLRELVEKCARSRRGKFERHDLVVPLVNDGGLFGVLYAGRPEKSPDLRERDLEMAEIFAQQVSVALQNARLYVTIRKRNDELLRILNIKDTLVQRISEELQAPLGDIRKVLEGVAAAQGQEAGLERARSLCDRTLRLVGKILDTRVLEEEAAQIFADAVDFRGLVDGILARHAEEVAARQLSVRVNIGTGCNGYRGSENIMRTIFDELISNAVFYNRTGGTVAIQGRRSREYLVFMISDTGTGIAAADQERIFEQFTRTETSEELNPAGAGLGLFMVREFLKYYGGTVSLRSNPGVGTRFTVTLLRH